MFTRSILGLFVLAFTTGCWEEEDKSEGTDDTGLTTWSSSSSYGDESYTETGGDCEEECGELWREVYAECIDGGGSEEDCEMRADEAHRACLADCDETERETDETERETDETEREEVCEDGDILERGEDTYICRDGEWFLEE